MNVNIEYRNAAAAAAAAGTQSVAVTAVGRTDGRTGGRQ